jgi:hypothetical protein
MTFSTDTDLDKCFKHSRNIIFFDYASSNHIGSFIFRNRMQFVSHSNESELVSLNDLVCFRSYLVILIKDYC